MSKSTKEATRIPAGTGHDQPAAAQLGEPADAEAVAFREQLEQSPLDVLVRRGARQMLQAPGATGFARAFSDAACTFGRGCVDVVHASLWSIGHTAAGWLGR